MPKKDYFIQKQNDSMLNIYKDKATIEAAFFQHSVLCQTFLPYRDPGDEVKMWQQKQGQAHLAISATPILNPQTNSYELSGIPFGPKARLILAHINTQAIKTQNKVIDVEDSMTAFIKSIGLGTDGRTIRQVKEQLRRLSASTLSVGFSDGAKSVQVDFKIVKAFDLWFPKNDSQRVLWPSTVILNDDYFSSLMNHAIPLDERALAALSNNAMAMDIYSWLAQRLHRIPQNAPQFISWQNMKEQFGQGYDRMDNFKTVFRKTLKMALKQYPIALTKIEEVPNKGFKLANAQPPIVARNIIQLDTK
ncbi:RepA protein [Larkinella arboricola]|uniref:RepA protein n=1 Tax=Larkinella arboricola TaxID=643671 RepID=A0A327WFD2_LARAB|nr:replication protein RepA [Larkinella arboricola]RAJ89920.1 RepA protein [Larkinella arboricola]